VSEWEREFREYVHAHTASLHRTAYMLCGDWHTAQDLTQETLANAYRGWHRVRQADNTNAYVRRILVNEARQRWRRRRNRAQVATATTEPHVPDSAEQIVGRAELFEALLRLPLRQRATVVLRYLDGLSERETATALGCSQGTVKSQTSRALNSLRTLLERTESTL
jgi:RNA polymerase sigma-70 factor (sigma-E family)